MSLSSIFGYLSDTPIKLIRVAYVVGLSIIAGMSIGAHVIVDRVVNQSEYSASTINIAGKQRMLSQRMAYFLVTAVQTRDADDILHFHDAVTEFERNHFGLLNGDEELSLPGVYPASVETIYFAPEHQLHAMIIKHIDTLKGFYEQLRNDEAIAQAKISAVLEYTETDLLFALNMVVKAYEKSANEKIDNLISIQRFSIMAILLALIAEAIVIFNPLVQRLQRYSENLEFVATHDQLTKVPNRRAFFATAESEFDRAKRYEDPISVLMCDLDHFKSINDAHGHQIGDEVLKQFARLATATLRAEDVFARIGGEEFAVILPKTDAKSACVVAERICNAIRTNPIELQNGETLTVTTSIGIADYGFSAAETVESVLGRADVVLYEAKRNGRDGYALASYAERKSDAGSSKDQKAKTRNAIILGAAPGYPSIA
ncbi:MAG: diguanylate cyclase [Pseudomonadota bacterium]